MKQQDILKELTKDEFHSNLPEANFLLQTKVTKIQELLSQEFKVSPIPFSLYILHSISYLREHFLLFTSTHILMFLSFVGLISVLVISFPQSPIEYVVQFIISLLLFLDAAWLKSGQTFSKLFPPWSHDEVLLELSIHIPHL